MRALMYMRLTLLSRSSRRGSCGAASSDFPPRAAALEVVAKRDVVLVAGLLKDVLCTLRNGQLQGSVVMRLGLIEIAPRHLGFTDGHGLSPSQSRRSFT